jgi:hypothetical protein
MRKKTSLAGLYFADEASNAIRTFTGTMRDL